MLLPSRFLKPVADVVLTLVFWTYFTLGFVLFFAPAYFIANAFSADREHAFQRLNHRFYKGFFGLVRILTPGLAFEIADAVRNLRGTVIFSNHLSYLDPILLISLFGRQKTIVKSRFFFIPIFGTVLKRSGYLPSETSGDLEGLMLTQMGAMDRFLAKGGNLFIFPEGTRSLDGRLGKLNKGGFKIARRCRAEIAVIRIAQTDRLFRPGRFLFNTCRPVNIRVDLIERWTPDYDADGFRVSDLAGRVRRLLGEASDMKTMKAETT